jgi:hypothetical protein
MHGKETQDGSPNGERDWTSAARRSPALPNEEVGAAAAPTHPHLRRDSQAKHD